MSSIYNLSLREIVNEFYKKLYQQDKPPNIKQTMLERKNRKYNDNIKGKI